MIKYMKAGSCSEIAEAVGNGLGWNEALKRNEPWVGYDPVAQKMYCLAENGDMIFDYSYTVGTTCQDEQEEVNENVQESRGAVKAPQYYDTKYYLYGFGDAYEPGTVIPIDQLPACAEQEEGKYQLIYIKYLYVDGNQIDIFVDNGMGGYDEYDEFYFNEWSIYSNIKLTYKEIPQNEQPERGMTKAEPVYGWVLTFDEHQQR